MTEAQLPRRVRVIEPHVTNDPNPIRFRAGDTLGVGHHDQVWKLYVWGTDQAGRSGWVPDTYLEISPDGRTATALRDYDSTELSSGASRSSRCSTKSAAGTCAAPSRACPAGCRAPRSSRSRPRQT